MAPLLTLEDISVSYRDGSRREAHVLKDLSLDIHPGEMIGVWGVRRAGKTTLANVMAGRIRPDRGRVLLNGHELPVPRRLYGPYVHEDVALVHCGRPEGPRDRRTVIDYVSRGLRKKQGLRFYERHARRRARRRATDALALFGLMEYADERWGHLAHRERVLVALAEAVASMPRLLIIDDFGLGIDPLQRDQLSASLRKLTESDISIVVTTESVSNLLGSHHLVALTDGELMSADQSAQVITFPATRRSA